MIARDPSNVWLAGFSRLRLDAESIRDTMLAVGENLDVAAAGAHPFPHQSTWSFTQHKPFKAVYESNHRSVYLMTQRIQRHPFLAIFDGADPSTSTAARLNSTTPLQALYLLNNPFMHEQSRLVAQRIESHADDDPGRLEFAYQLLFARPATSDETIAGIRFLNNVKSLLTDSARTENEIEHEAWQACVRALIRLNEFVYLD